MLFSDFKTLNKWFHDKYMIINPDKCSYIGLDKNNDDDSLSVNEFSLKKSNNETIIEIKVDQKLTLSNHIKTLYTKACPELLLAYQTILIKIKKTFV